MHVGNEIDGEPAKTLPLFDRGRRMSYHILEDTIDLLVSFPYKCLNEGHRFPQGDVTVGIWSWDHRSQENNIEKTSLSRSAYG